MDVNEKARLNRVVAEARGYIAFPLADGSCMCSLPHGSRDSFYVDYCSDLNAIVAACEACGYYPHLYQAVDGWVAMLGVRHDTEFGKGVMWDAKKYEADHPALALTLAFVGARGGATKTP